MICISPTLKGLVGMAFVFISSIGVSVGQNSMGVGTNSPNPNAILELVSTGNNQGFLVPRLTTAQRTTLAGSLGAGDVGLMLYDSDNNNFYFWDGSAWMTMSGGPVSVNSDGTTILGDGDGTDLSVNTGTGADQIVQLDGFSRLPGVDGSQLTNVTSGNFTGTLVGDITGTQGATTIANGSVSGGTGGKITDNTITDDDINSISTGVITGLGTAAPLNVGMASGDVVQLDATGLPAVDGSQLANVTSGNFTGTLAGDVTGTQGATTIANSAVSGGTGGKITDNTITDDDINSISTGVITGLGTAASLNAGVAANNAVQLDALSRLPAVDASFLTNVPTTGSLQTAYTNGPTISTSGGNPFNINGSEAISLSAGSGNNLSLFTTGNLLFTGANFSVGGTGVVTATSFSGDGSNLTNLPVSMPGTDNVVGGTGSGALLSTGTQNTFFGENSGPVVNAGDDNTFVGFNTGVLNSIGSSNTFIGNGAGATNTTGTFNTLVGDGANVSLGGLSNTVAVGDGAIAGSSNTVSVGTSASASGARSMALGNISVASNSDAIAIGHFSQATADGAIAIGDNIIAAQANSIILGNISDSYRVGVGTTTPTTTLDVNGTVTATAFDGDGSNLTNLVNAGDISGTSSVAIGSNAGVNNTGNFNAFFGENAGQSNTTAQNNTFIGYNAGNANITNSASTYIGSNSGGNSTNINNTFTGYNSGLNNTGANNTVYGHTSGSSATGLSGNGNVFVGSSAGRENTTAGFNTLVGANAGRDNTSGISNTYIGQNAGIVNDGGGNNTLIGAQAGALLTSGNDNVFIGQNTASGITSSTGNVLIGRSATLGSNGLSNSVAIGNNVSVDQSNAIVLGGLATNVGIGTSTPSSKLDVNGAVTATSFSGSGAGLTGTPGTFSTTGEIPRGNGSGLVASNIFSDGTNVGIGTTTPVSDFQIFDDFHMFHFDDGATVEAEIIGENVHPNGTIIEYTKTAPASFILQSQGRIQFLTVLSGTAGTNALLAADNTLILQNDGDAAFGGAVEFGDYKGGGIPQVGMIRYSGVNLEGYVSGAWTSLTESGFNLPLMDQTPNASTLLHLINDGTGSAGKFEILNTGSSQSALIGETDSDTGGSRAVHGIHTGIGGPAGEFQIINGTNSQTAIVANTTGTGSAASFQISNAGSGASALSLNNNGAGQAIFANKTNTGNGFELDHSGASGDGLNIDLSNAAATGFGIFTSTAGTGAAAEFAINNALNGNAAVTGVTTGTGAGVRGLNVGTSGQAAFFNISNGGNTSPVVQIDNGGAGPSLLVSTGNVGIGIASPAEMLDVNGSIQVSGVSEFKYASAKTRILSLSNKAFSAEGGNTTGLATFGGTLGKWITNGNAGTQADLTAGVQLPDGAVVTQVDAYVIDDSAPYDISVRLSRGTHGTTVGGIGMTNVVSTGIDSPAVQNLTTTTVNSATVNNTLYHYYFTVVTRQAEPELSFLSVVIHYTVLQAD